MPGFPQRAFLLAHTTIQAPAAGSMDWETRAVFSTNAGSTWTDATGAWFAGQTTTAEWICALYVQIVNRNPSVSPLGGSTPRSSGGTNR